MTQNDARSTADENADSKHYGRVFWWPQNLCGAELHLIKHHIVAVGSNTRTGGLNTPPSPSGSVCRRHAARHTAHQRHDAGGGDGPLLLHHQGPLAPRRLVQERHAHHGPGGAEAALLRDGGRLADHRAHLHGGPGRVHVRGDGRQHPPAGLRPPGRAV